MRGTKGPPRGQRARDALGPPSADAPDAPAAGASAVFVFGKGAIAPELACELELCTVVARPTVSAAAHTPPTPLALPACYVCLLPTEQESACVCRTACHKSCLVLAMSKTGSATCTICKAPVANAELVSRKRLRMPEASVMTVLVLLAFVLVGISTAFLNDLEPPSTSRRVPLTRTAKICALRTSHRTTAHFEPHRNATTALHRHV